MISEILFFAGDRLKRTVDRVEKIKEEIKDSPYNMAEAAIRFVLAHPAVSTVITGIRNKKQAEMNTSIADLPEMPDNLIKRLQKHYWIRGLWYAGK